MIKTHFMFRYIVFFCSFGGVQQASKITGPRKRPSQSPSMRLLGMLHIADPDGGFPKDRFCKLVCTLISFCFVTFLVKFCANTRRHIAEYRDLARKICATLSEAADEGVGTSQEYGGEQGRFLPPQRSSHRPGGNYTRSLSSQL